jgi:CHAT domain-containing protein
MRAAMDPGKAIIEYYLGGNDLYSYVVTSKDFYIAKISVDTTQRNAIKHYCESIYNDDFEFFIENNHSLYNLFIKPVLYLMDSCVKSIMIIPDDNFYNLPFETLVNNNISVNNISFSKLNYLIRRYEISYYYSLSLFSNIIERNYGLEKNQTNFVGFAPVFNGSSKINGVSLNNLKYAIDEVSLIGDLYKERGNQTRLFLGSEASESNFKKNISNYRYIHIATHGYSDDFEPSMSFLAFTQSKKITNGSLINDSTDENNILHANEMYNLTLSADLIVLSACETGVGKVIKGEGVMTMTRGFIYSGAKNIIHTLWNIDDETTQKLMVSFYTNVLDNKSYSYSLREAKLKLIDSEITAFPHFWAGYILIGQ